MGAARPAAIACLSLGLTMSCGRAPERREPPPPRPNLLLVTLDTTRADRLGCYGYARPTTPNLDRLAREATVYDAAYSTSSWTLPAHATLFTGRFESSHGARYDPAGPLSLADAVAGPAEWKGYRVRPLTPDAITVAEALTGAGYATGAVVAGPWLKRAFGLDQGFGYYDDDQITDAGGRRAEQVTDTALRWLERNRSRPFFLFLNYYDPHGPYDAPEPFGRSFLPAGARLSPGVPKGSELSARYDGEVLYADHHLGRLIDALRRQGLYERTLIVVTADHGELLEEHGLVGHGHHLYQEEIRIPLIAKEAGGAAASREAGPVQLVDIFPLLLARLGVTAPAGLQGGTPPRVAHPIVAEVYPPAFNSPAGDWRALIRDELKFVWNGRGRHQLFDLARDPREEVNLLATRRAAAKEMEGRLEKYLSSLPGPGPVGSAAPVDAATREALRSLGYVR